VDRNAEFCIEMLVAYLTTGSKAEDLALAQQCQTK